MSKKKKKYTDYSDLSNLCKPELKSLLTMLDENLWPGIKCLGIKEEQGDV